MFTLCAWRQAWTCIHFCHTCCRRIPLLNEVALNTLIKAEVSVLKECLRGKRRKGFKKYIGGLPSMKCGKLFAQAEANVLARLARGGVATASSSSMNELPSQPSSPPSSSSIVSCSSESPSSVSPASSTSPTLPVRGGSFYLG